MWTMPVPSSIVDVGPRDDAVLDLRRGGEVVVGPLVALADELLALDLGDDLAAEGKLGQSCFGDPEKPVRRRELHVLGLWVDGRRDVGGQRPRRRRPDDERLALVVEER